MSILTSHNTAEIALSVAGHAAQLLRFEAVERVGELFRFQADVVFRTPPREALMMGDCLGTAVTVTVKQADAVARYFNGIILATEFLDQTATQNGREWLHHVRIYMVPQLFIYTQNKDFRVFEEKTAPDIIKEVLEKSGISGANVVSNLKATYEVRGYTTQFGESNFAFLSRLMEEEGIYYYFQHEERKHSIVLCDGPSSHSTGKPAELEYNTAARHLNLRGRGGDLGDQLIHTWVQKQTVHAQKEVTLWDNLFSMPGNTIEAKVPSQQSDNDVTKFFRAVETYDFQGTYELHQPANGADQPDIGSKHVSAARTRAQIRTQILEARRKIYTGAAMTPILACGRKFKLNHQPQFGTITEFLLLSVRTVVYGPAFESVNGSVPWPDDATIEIEALPADYVWRSQPRTPRPIVHGPQTAIVVGPAGEDIYTDKYGRVKVQFYWDRYGKKDPHSSAWLRVSQTGGLGNIILPRVGHEVLVGFLDGNPDRPIVIGRLFNAENPPLYPLPDNKARAVWHTHTYPHNQTVKSSPFKDVDIKDAKGNELRFDDKADKQEIFLLANKDMNTRIFNDETHHVGNNQTINVLKDFTHDVQGNEKRDVKGTSTVKITGDYKVNMEAASNSEIKGKNTLKIDGDDKQTYGAKSEVTVGTELSIKANTKIVLAVGSNSIEISQSGIKINGLTLKLEATGPAEMSGALTTVKASGILTAQGSMVKIN